MNWARSAFTILTVKFIIGLPIYANSAITNPLRSDGFGSQYQTIIYSIVCAELMGNEFVYTPFRALEHNYDNDPDYLNKMEWLVNLIGYYPVNHDIHLQTRITPSQYISFFETYLQASACSISLKKLKELFRKNKERKSYFDDEHFHIAVHIRRPNPHDNRVAGTNSPDRIYVKAINQLREKYRSQNPLFHLISQGNEIDFRNTFKGDDILFHINTPVEDSFPRLVLADALVTSTSSFSYTAGLLSNGAIYYIPFWHPPLPHWNVLNTQE